MILKGSQRGGGQDLAVHLMRLDDNEHIDIHELRGFAGETLKEAFKEVEAVSRGTKCRQYLFSLSLSPPADRTVSAESFVGTIDRIEERLGLEGQPRAIVFHEKEGRRHAHCVWSRIDADTMTARHLPFFKSKLMGMARELYLENDWTLPKGLRNAAERNPTNFTLAEWQQAKRQGIDPRWLKQTVQNCWNRSDSTKAFGRSLEEHGFMLAKGDRRSVVVLDHAGEVWSLPRALGLKSKEVTSRLGEEPDLPGVAAAKKRLGERMTPTIQRHIKEARAKFDRRAAQLERYRSEMTHLHRTARQKLGERQGQEWDAETRVRADRLPRGLRGLWHRIIGQYRKVRLANEAEALATQRRHARQTQALISRQLGERAVIQKAVVDLRREQAAQLLALRRDLGRYLTMRAGDGAERTQGPGLGLGMTR
ncbi:MAG TPA: relaxase [Devosia sp.]